MNTSAQNVDAAEIDKFSRLAAQWWNPEGEFKSLHEINPLRLGFIREHSGSLTGKNVLDVGCGGGILSEAKGVGSTTCATLLSMLPELGKVSHKRLALLVGIVPPPQQSGDKDKKTGCTGGRKMVRNALYMASLSATRFEPKIMDFYTRLVSRGKPFKVAINACMHKLLRILNARMRDYLASLKETEESELQGA